MLTCCDCLRFIPHFENASMLDAMRFAMTATASGISNGLAMPKLDSQLLLPSAIESLQKNRIDKACLSRWSVVAISTIGMAAI